MHIHLGNGVSVPEDEILCLIDLTRQTKDTQSFLQSLKDMGCTVGREEGSSTLVLTQRPEESACRAFLSMISVATLKARCHHVLDDIRQNTY